MNMGFLYIANQLSKKDPSFHPMTPRELIGILVVAFIILFLVWLL
jgi:hypothetical protein